MARGAPVIGNGVALARDAPGTFVRCYHELGPIYRLRGPGRRYTVLAGPKALPAAGRRAPPRQHSDGRSRSAPRYAAAVPPAPHAAS